jgi:uncharacterized membrane protein
VQKESSDDRKKRRLNAAVLFAVFVAVLTVIVSVVNCFTDGIFLEANIFGNIYGYPYNIFGGLIALTFPIFVLIAFGIYGQKSVKQKRRKKHEPIIVLRRTKPFHRSGRLR